ncbi:hypothetical protein [Halomonas alkaliantarctica]|uniref:hypothetical protein n=1 Tax=Halomonas alkaliantarctica TaxID=232346 RepID=UPI0004AAC5D0|nr:hypothetical protein [Halomonas alkaliantarctica]
MGRNVECAYCHTCLDHWKALLLARWLTACVLLMSLIGFLLVASVAQAHVTQAQTQRMAGVVLAPTLSAQRKAWVQASIAHTLTTQALTSYATRVPLNSVFTPQNDSVPPATALVETPTRTPRQRAIQRGLFTTPLAWHHGFGARPLLYRAPGASIPWAPRPPNQFSPADRQWLLNPLPWWER